MTMQQLPIWVGPVISWPLSFVLGVLYGRFSVIHKEALMSVRTKARAWYDRHARALFLALACVATLGVLLGATASLQARDVAKQNRDDLVTSCVNANESRAAAKSLWSYVIDVSTASNTDATKSERRFLGDFRDYVGAVYVPHDCTDLSKKYPLPDPPRIRTPHPTR